MEWRQRLPLIWAIVRKDLVRSRSAIVIVTIVAGVFAFLLSPLALSLARFPSVFRWSDFLLRPLYAASAGLTGLTLALTFYTVHGGEIHKGTIRSIILYPVDANDIALAKLASTLLITLILTAILFFVPLGAFFVLGVWPFPDFLALHLMTLSIGFVSLSTGVLLAQVLAHWFKRMIVSPSGLGSLFLLASAVLTESVANGIASQIVLLLVRSRDQFPTPQDFEAALSFARTVSVLSPYHWGARILSQGFGVFPPGGEVLIAIPVALTMLAIVGGYVFGKKLYLDAYIQ